MFRINVTPEMYDERLIITMIMEKNREACKIDGKILSHTFGKDTGSISCFVPNKDKGYFLAFEIETRVPYKVSVELSQ